MNLIIAVPSKGRLKENALETFANAGLKLSMPEDARSYRGEIASLEGVEIAFLSASEIARELALGTVHMGITGEDLVRENIARWQQKLELTRALGFGRADVVGSLD